MREGHVELQGAKLWYRDAGGEGEPVLFLHAATGHAGFFGASQVPAFAAAGYRPITYDRRGYRRTLCDAEHVKALPPMICWRWRMLCVWAAFTWSARQPEASSRSISR